VQLISRKKQEILKMHDENKISCLSSDHHQDMKKKILYLKKNDQDGRRKKIPKQIFVD